MMKKLLLLVAMFAMAMAVDAQKLVLDQSLNPGWGHQTGDDFLSTAITAAFLIMPVLQAHFCLKRKRHDVVFSIKFCAFY